MLRVPSEWELIGIDYAHGHETLDILDCVPDTDLGSGILTY